MGHLSTLRVQYLHICLCPVLIVLIVYLTNIVSGPLLLADLAPFGLVLEAGILRVQHLVVRFLIDVTF